MNSRSKHKLRVGNRSVSLGERTLIMGVINATPDSFSDGGKFFKVARAIERGVELARAGADWIDVGGESTRPGATPVAAKEELRRVIPVIRGLRMRMPALGISIDTTKAEVAEAAVRAGATVLNDISGLRFDPRLAEVARRHGTPLVLMHIRGTPATMQTRPFARDIWRSVREGLAWSVRRALAAGLRRSQLLIDPGVGFGKTRRQNLEILAHLGRLRGFKLPILIGTSRKSFVQAIVAGEGLHPARTNVTQPSGRAPAALQRDATRNYWRMTRGRERGVLLHLATGDAAAVVASILGGAHIVRVHDVETIIPAVRIADAVLSAGSS